MNRLERHAGIRDFHLKMDPIVRRIFLYTVRDELIGEMIRMPAIKELSIFNGRVPSSQSEIKILLMGEELISEYTFNRIFSVPFDPKNPPKGPTWSNYICINTPDQIRHVVLEFPDGLQSFFGLPGAELMHQFHRDKIKIKEDSDIIKMGIDPQAKNFTRGFTLVLPSAEYMNLCDENILSTILNEKITVRCYFSSGTGSIKFEDNVNMTVTLGDSKN